MKSLTFEKGNAASFMACWAFSYSVFGISMYSYSSFRKRIRHLVASRMNSSLVVKPSRLFSWMKFSISVSSSGGSITDCESRFSMASV